MKPKNKRKGIDRTAPRCPYCGSHTILRSADGIYRENARNDMLYVCKNYPVCDSYVRVQRGTKIPLGTVANRELRELRAEAHRQFDKLYKHGYMSKHDAYQWLGGILSVPAKQAHIAQLSLLSCNLVIREAKKQVNWYHMRKMAALQQTQEGDVKAWKRIWVWWERSSRRRSVDSVSPGPPVMRICSKPVVSVCAKLP